MDTCSFTHTCIHTRLQVFNLAYCEELAVCSQMKTGGSEQEDDTERKETAKKNGKKEESEEDKGEECAAYEFSVTETTILEVVMDSMRTCGLAIGLLALSSLMLGETTPAVPV